MAEEIEALGATKALAAPEEAETKTAGQLHPEVPKTAGPLREPPEMLQAIPAAEAPDTQTAHQKMPVPNTGNLERTVTFVEDLIPVHGNNLPPLQQIEMMTNSLILTK